MARGYAKSGMNQRLGMVPTKATRRKIGRAKRKGKSSYRTLKGKR